MIKPIIEIKNISKKYQIDHERGRYVALRDVLTNIAKHPFAFLKTKAAQATGLEKKEQFWALKNIDFKVNRGEVIGIIGHNGAGKSTLLKILSQITPPTEGEIIIRGTVGSLLEVGTGFHPELTGRENIFLNGAILGMGRREIAAKFDQIVEFAGVEKFIDTPVKRYSSGMYVRLAFSVAAHMEPDILVVDEVLAVGDAEFQKKCLGKMEEVTRSNGRTILFVSHNMAAIRQLCTKCVLLSKGGIKTIGKTDEVVDMYLQQTNDLTQIPIRERIDRSGNGGIRITNVLFKNQNGETVSHLDSGKDAEIWIEYDQHQSNIEEINFSLGIDALPSQYRIALISNQVTREKIALSPTRSIIKISLQKLSLNAGDYQFTVFADHNGNVLDWVKQAGQFTVIPGFYYASGETPKQGNLLLDYHFNPHHE